MKTGLYFGSFNPIHIGHMAIANYIVEYTDLDDICFVVSPHNPLKKKSSLLANHHRLRLTEIACENDERFSFSDIEARLPQPSYTIDTLTYLAEKQPKKEFSLIMGKDNLLTLHKWKNPEELVKKYEIIIYPRNDDKRMPHPDLEELLKKARIRLVEAPNMEISGTFIRNAISEGKNISHFLPPGVWQYIKDMHFYE